MAVEGGGATVGSCADGGSRPILFAVTRSGTALFRMLAGLIAALGWRGLPTQYSSTSNLDTENFRHWRHKGAEPESPCARKSPICAPSHKKVGLTTCLIFWSPLRCWQQTCGSPFR